MINFSLAEETLGYQTSTDPANSDKRLLVAPSQNVLIDYQKKVYSRPGYYRFGVGNATLFPIRNAWTWNTSTGADRPQRHYSDQLEVYLGTVDTTVINAWTKVSAGWSLVNKIRAATWFDTTESLDVQVMVNGDMNLYEWSGGVAVVSSAAAGAITKAGTTTFAQNRFYATRNKSLVCVRTGTVYTYTAGETTTTLTGVTGDTSTLVAGDVLVQSIVTQSNKPVATQTNDYIMVFQNQAIVASKSNQNVYASKNTSYYDFTFSSPRLFGEGWLATPDAIPRALAAIGSFIVIFAGKSSAYKINYQRIGVGSTLAETIDVKRLDTGVNQGALNQESVIQLGNSIAYLTNEVALRIIQNPENLVGIDPKTFSTPIKPDFDAERWDVDQTYGIFYKNNLIFSAGATSHTYILTFVQDADGKILRFWNPPQTLPAGAFSIIDAGTTDGYVLCGHSNSVPETYKLFYGLSDGQYDSMDVADKLPINAQAWYAYDNGGSRKSGSRRAVLNNFDEYYIEGEITPNTIDLTLGLNYDYNGSVQSLERTIDGSDETILQGVVEFNSLAQQSLGVYPLASLLNPPAGSRRFRVVFEIAKEDFHQIQDHYATNDVDRYWAISARGANTTLSARRDTVIRK